MSLAVRHRDIRTHPPIFLLSPPNALSHSTLFDACTSKTTQDRNLNSTRRSSRHPHAKERAASPSGHTHCKFPSGLPGPQRPSRSPLTLRDNSERSRRADTGGAGAGSSGKRLAEGPARARGALTSQRLLPRSSGGTARPRARSPGGRVGSPHPAPGSYRRSRTWHSATSREG